MARRAGGRGGRSIPGLAAALADRSRADGRQWASQSALDFADAVDRGESVTVDGETIWRSMFDRRYPNDWEEFIGDKGMYTVTADRLTPAETADSAGPSPARTRVRTYIDMSVEGGADHDQ